MPESRWLIFAFLSASFAALVGTFAKIGMKDVDSTLATVVRSVVMTVLLCVVGTKVSVWSKLATIQPRAFAAIVISGAAGALSWLFYFKAIQISSVSQVAPIDKLSMPLTIVMAVILLGERPSLINWLGILLVSLGAYLAIVPSRSN